MSKLFLENAGGPTQSYKIGFLASKKTQVDAELWAHGYKNMHPYYVNDYIEYYIAVQGNIGTSLNGLLSALAPDADYIEEIGSINRIDCGDTTYEWVEDPDRGIVNLEMVSVVNNDEGSVTTTKRTAITLATLEYTMSIEVATDRNDRSKDYDLTTIDEYGGHVHEIRHTTKPDIAGNIRTDVTIITYNENGEYVNKVERTIFENADGSNTTSTENYNEEGTITQSTTVSDYSGMSGGCNEEGWETITETVNYDDDGRPTDGENVWIDPAGNENTQSIEYNGGNPEVVGYVIDTTNNQDGGEFVTEHNATGLDTDLVVFNGKGFYMSLKVKYNASENLGDTTNGRKAIFAALQNGTSSGYYIGFNFFQTSAGKYQMYSCSIQQSPSTGTGFIGSQVSMQPQNYTLYSANTYYQYRTTYEIEFWFLPQGYGGNTNSWTKVRIKEHAVGNDGVTEASFDLSNTSSQSNIPTSLADATFVLGGNGCVLGCTLANFEVLEFNITRLEHD